MVAVRLTLMSWHRIATDANGLPGAAVYFPYCSSLTFSIHSTFLPPASSWIAMWVMAVALAAPCQFLLPAASR